METREPSKANKASEASKPSKALETLSADKKYLKIFQEHEGVSAFMTTKYAAHEGWPYFDEEVFEAIAPDGYIPVGHWQTHGTNIMVIDDAEIAKYKAGDTAPEYDAANSNGNGLKYVDSDGAITDIKGVLLTSMHADCTPIFFYDPVRGAIGMVHSGWKGTVAEIGRITALKLQEVYGCDPKNIYVHIGPSISKCCFEVDRDVFEMFKEPEYSKKGEKFYINLKEYNRRMLMEAGIPSANITISEHCSCCEPELFCSYRASGTKLRMGAGIIMK